jgi:hypothetical protein
MAMLLIIGDLLIYATVEQSFQHPAGKEDAG